MTGRKQPLTPLEEPPEVDKAWAAGFFDGEGSTTACKNGTEARFMRLVLSQSRGENELILRLQRVLGGNVTQYGQKWRWRITGHNDVIRALKWMWPYLGPYKKLQARRALDTTRVKIKS